MNRHEDNENEVERASKKIFKDETFMGIQDEYFDNPDMVKVKAIEQIVKPLHDKIGKIVGTKEVKPPSGDSYLMYIVELNESVNVGGGIMMKELYMPETCFEVINGKV